MRGVVAGAEQALLFGRQCHEQEAALRPRAGGKDARQFQHAGHAGGVVDRAMANAVAGRIGFADAEGVPVCGENHGFVGMRGAIQAGNDIVRHHLFAPERETCARACIAQRHRLEARLHGLGA